MLQTITGIMKYYFGETADEMVKQAQAEPAKATN